MNITESNIHFGTKKKIYFLSELILKPIHEPEQ